MMVLVFCLICIFAAITAEAYGPRQCSVPKHYGELGCKAIHDEKSYCPTRFDCGFLAKREPSKCYYKGMAYDIGEDLITDPENPCAIGCSCIGEYKGVTWSCDEVDCFEDYYDSENTSNCYQRYSLDNCCSQKYCHPDARENVQMPPLAQCEYNGKTYLEGQYIDTDLPCSACICQPGFNGTLTKPWCREISCGIELYTQINEDCVPVYYGTSRCCPIDSRCPADDDKVVRVKSTKFRLAKKCKFGNLKLKIGDKLSPTSNKCVDCSCSLPPLVTCIQNKECDY